MNIFYELFFVMIYCFYYLAKVVFLSLDFVYSHK